MSDLIFKTKGKETFPTPEIKMTDKIPFPAPGTKCPETELKIKMTEPITLTLTVEELQLLDKYVEKTDDTYSVLMKIKDAYPQPKMEYQESGTVDKVEYNGHTYLRIMYDDSTSFGGVWWKQIERHKSPMNIVTDDVTRNVLEGLWYDQVKKVKPSLTNCFIEGNPPNGYSSWYKWFEELGSKGILHNLRISSEDFKEKVEEPTKPMDEVVERLLKKYQEQKLYNRLFEFGYDKEDCEVILCLVEDWLPEPQNASGSQNVNTELLVDGFNHCLQKIKEMLR